jgi:hypothetical protein
MFDNNAMRNAQNASGLHTLAEEGSKSSKELKRQSTAANGHRSYKNTEDENTDESVAMSSLQDMINTLKSLPPIPSSNRLSTQNIEEPSNRRGHRKQQSMSAINLHRNRFSQTIDQNNKTHHTSMQELRNLPEIPEKRTSKFLSATQNTGRKSDDEESSEYYSRGDALAEAEAKLMGTYKPKEESIESTNTSIKDRRRSGRRYSDSNGSDHPSFSTVAAPSFGKRISLQLPTLSETSEIAANGKSKRLTFNKPLDLSLEKNGHRRSTSRNFDSDWRAGKNTGS